MNKILTQKQEKAVQRQVWDLDDLFRGLTYVPKSMKDRRLNLKLQLWAYRRRWLQSRLDQGREIRLKFKQEWEAKFRGPGGYVANISEVDLIRLVDAIHESEGERMGLRV